MVPLGTGPSVGAGFVLGGGYSLASKYLGMGCDAVAAMEVVLADGSVVRASETENPDLLWALRGGGSSGFGVVTAMTLRVSPLPRTVSLMRFEWADGAAALPHWEDFLVLTLKDRRVNPQGLMKSNGGARSNVFYFGPISELEALVAPWLAKAPPLVSVSKKEGVWMDFVEQFGRFLAAARLRFRRFRSLLPPHTHTAAFRPIVWAPRRWTSRAKWWRTRCPASIPRATPRSRRPGWPCRSTSGAVLAAKAGPRP